MAEISVIIPVYNAEKTLAQCLKSIFNQTYKNIEVIAINDGSADRSLQILQNCKEKITIIDQENFGAAKARNAGEKISRSPFIIFCDADVVMKPNMLEIMIKALKNNPEVSYVYSAFKYGFKTFRLAPFDGEKLKAMPYIHTTSLIRHESFPGFDPKLKRFQDWDLWLTMLERGHVGHYIPEVLFKINPGGTMSAWLPRFVFWLPFLNNVKKYKEAEKIIREKHRLGNRG